MKRISEVSKLVGVSTRTLQYYDDEGIFVVERSENNHRLYDEKAMKMIWKILLYKEMGFELKEIKQLLSVSSDKQEEYLSLRIDNIKSEVGKLKDQIAFISSVLSHGIPHIPKESDGMTYTMNIKEMRKKLKMKEAIKNN